MADTLYRFKYDCGRHGTLVSLFIATEDDVDGLIGREFNFGEALGKHSEIRGEFSADNFEIVSQDQRVVDALRSFASAETHWYFGGVVVGVSPRDAAYYENDRGEWGRGREFWK